MDTCCLYPSCSLVTCPVHCSIYSWCPIKLCLIGLDGGFCTTSITHVPLWVDQLPYSPRLHTLSSQLQRKPTESQISSSLVFRSLRKAELEGASETIYGLPVLLRENQIPSARKHGRGKSTWGALADLDLILTPCSFSMHCLPKHHIIASFFSSVKVGIKSYLPGVGNINEETVYGPQLPTGIHR